MVSHETKEQIAIFEWLSLQKDILPDCHHVANEGKRRVSEWVKLKKMGLTKGFSDIFIAVPTEHYHGLFIELKSKRSDGKYGKPTKEQLDFIDRKNMRGYYAKVSYGMDDAIDTIKKYLSGKLLS